LREVDAWTTANGLTLHPDKTRIVDSQQPGQGFDFLGYRFEAGCRFVRKKSLRALKDKVRAKTIRSRGDSLARIIADLNPALRGRVSERMCKQVSVSLPYRGDSHDDQYDDYTGTSGSTAC
jgi:hypothetical protein